MHFDFDTKPKDPSIFKFKKFARKLVNGVRALGASATTSTTELTMHRSPQTSVTSRLLSWGIRGEQSAPGEQVTDEQLEIL